MTNEIKVFRLFDASFFSETKNDLHECFIEGNFAALRIINYHKLKKALKCSIMTFEQSFQRFQL